EVANAAGRFQNLSALKTKPLRCLIHGADDNRRGVMGVEGGGAGGTVFLVGQDFRKLDLFPVPGRAVHVKHLGHRTPANIFDQQSFFVRGSRTISMALRFWENFCLGPPSPSRSSSVMR